VLERKGLVTALLVRGEGACRLIAAVAVLLQGFHHDPIQLAALIVRSNFLPSLAG